MNKSDANYPRGYAYGRSDELRPHFRRLGLNGLASMIGVSPNTLRRVLDGEPVYRLTEKRCNTFLDSAKSS